MSQFPSVPASPCLTFHGQHRLIADEPHARPPTPLLGPASVSRLTVTVNEEARAAVVAHFNELCSTLNCPLPPKGFKRHLLSWAGGRVVFEQHTEFCSLTFFKEGHADTNGALDIVPSAWLEGLSGDVLAASEVLITNAEPDLDAIETECQQYFGFDDFVGAQTGSHLATVATDFRTDDRGFVRFRVFSHTDNQHYIGRIAQNLIEIDSYRMAAMLGLPLAREIAGRLETAESRLEHISHTLRSEKTAVDELAILKELSDLAAAAEDMLTESSFRFSATQAYYAIVRERIERLRENSIPGRQRLGVFMDRRLAPAMLTCQSIGDRTQALSERVSRQVRLLSTRVEVQSGVNQAKLLHSLDQRSASQFRLQRMVERLSTVAISYYLISLLLYFLKGLHKSGALPVSPEIVVAVLTPFIVVLLWYITRQMHDHVEDDTSKTKANSE